MSDKYSATWVSHSSVGDFLKCARAYYLHNVYKDPKTGRKINVINPPLALGQAVHEVLEGLVEYKAEERMKEPLALRLEKNWKKYAGKKGGFKSLDEEVATKERALGMLARVEANPGPLINKTVRIPGDLPHYYLSAAENIILCGKVDWLEYMPEDDSVHIIDFKTGKNEENADSLQLPMYHLLVRNSQKRAISKASYWYLDRDDGLIEKELPSLVDAEKRVLDAARRVKAARETKSFDCPRGAERCFACRPFEAILSGEAEFVGVGEYNQDMYVL
ncbi:MAG: PD-(D/E)XK nuclease family protein [Patescibacteria group bacterium]